VPTEPSPPGPERPAARKVGSLRCPYHSWTYRLDGGLLRAPWTDDLDDFDPAGFSLHPVGVATWGGFVFVNLTPAEAAPLAGQLGPVPRRLRRYPLAALRVGRRLAYRVAANWRLVAENYNECYHCAGVHPELCRVVPAFKRGGTGLDWERGIPHREGAWTFTASGQSARAPFPGLDDDAAHGFKFAPLPGRVMAELALQGGSQVDLTPFAAGRPAQVAPGRQARYLV
jgi:glycine betaine catabolism A